MQKTGPRPKGERYVFKTESTVFLIRTDTAGE
jgi:hypothetical protein